jgi:regulator of protease activity HflC (stomatin/prohibitin superfamily)
MSRNLRRIKEYWLVYYRRLKDVWFDLWDKHSLSLSLTLILATLALLYLAPSIFISIKSGQAGVLYSRFWKGTQTNMVYGEGLHIKAPWDPVFIYDVRLQHVEQKFSIIASNGLSVEVSLSIRFRPKVGLLGVIHKELGPDYVNKIIIPEVQALTRDVFGRFSPEELYTTKRSVAQEILHRGQSEISEKYIDIDDLLVKDITLPASIRGAIEAKLMEEQRSFEMRFRIDRETQEAKRRLIEANGLNDYNRILDETLTESVLRYKGIEATLDLARSDNAKVVVMGGRDGLPLILDTRTELKPSGTNASDRLSKPRSLSSVDSRTNLPPATPIPK